MNSNRLSKTTTVNSSNSNTLLISESKTLLVVASPVSPNTLPIYLMLVILSVNVFLVAPAATAAAPDRQVELISCFETLDFSSMAFGDPSEVGVPEIVSLSTKISSFSRLLSSLERNGCWLL